MLLCGETGFELIPRTEAEPYHSIVARDGLEPPNTRVRVVCLTNLANGQKNMIGTLIGGAFKALLISRCFVSLLS